jgi:hypothetical protein
MEKCENFSLDEENGDKRLENGQKIKWSSKEAPENQGNGLVIWECRATRSAPN